VSAVYLPHTSHAFNRLGTRWSPAARVAVYVLERFLAVASVMETRTPTRAGAPGTDVEPQPATTTTPTHAGPSDDVTVASALDQRQ
jgi:hypothetical protein